MDSRGLPTLRCRATAKRTQQQCRSPAIVGGVVCHKHGGATRAAQAKADIRVSLAQLLGQDARPPWQVLLDALHASDAMMKDAISVIREQQGNLTPDQLDNLYQATERAAKLSKMTLDANVGERRTRLLEAQSSLMADAIGAGIDAVFARLVEQFHLDPDQEVELRQLALTTAAERAEAADDPRAMKPSKDGPLARDVRSMNKLKRMPPWIKKSEVEDLGPHPSVHTGEDVTSEVVPLHPPTSPLSE